MPFDVIAAALSAVLLGLTLVGLAVRYVLMPYLREHLIEPVKAGAELVEETHKQVTVNHHSSAQPTVLDRIDDVGQQVSEAIGKVDTLGRMFDGHLEQAAAAEIRVQAEVDRIWRALERRRNNDENP